MSNPESLHYFEGARQSINVLVDHLADQFDQKIGFKSSFDTEAGKILYEQLGDTDLIGRNEEENKKIHDELTGCLESRVGMSKKTASETAHLILHQLNKAHLNRTV